MCVRVRAHACAGQKGYMEQAASNLWGCSVKEWADSVYVCSLRSRQGSWNGEKLQRRRLKLRTGPFFLTG